jgi:TPR repeat protein
MPGVASVGFARCGLGAAGDLKDAESWLRQATAKDNPVAWNYLGALLTTKRGNEKAKPCDQKAVALRFASATLLARE